MLGQNEKPSEKPSHRSKEQKEVQLEKDACCFPGG